jgi:protease-4
MVRHYYRDMHCPICCGRNHISGFAERIGVVEIDGVITDGRQVMEDIVRFKEDKTIKGVIIRINSPGGSAAVSQEIYREIKKLKGKKEGVCIYGCCMCIWRVLYSNSRREDICDAFHLNR